MMTIRARLILTALVAIAGFLALAAFTIYSGQRNNRALADLYQGSVRPLVQLQRIDSELREVRYRAAAVLVDLMPVQGSLNHVREAHAGLRKTWADLQLAPPSSDAEQAALAAEMQRGWPKVEAVLDELEAAYAASDSKRLTDVLETDWAQAHTAFVKPLQKIIPLSEAQARATYEAAAAGNRRLSGLSLVLALVCLAVVALAIFFAARHIVRSLREAIEVTGAIARGDLSRPVQTERRDEVGLLLSALAQMRVSLSSTVSDLRRGIDAMAAQLKEFAAGSEALSSRTEQAAGSLQQTGASMEQMRGTVLATADNARQASELAASASGVAARGGEAMAQLVEAMAQIQESSREVNDIIAVIDGISFQTNILALNAAVEAARAGDQGRGFAVVAGEVRALAQRSAAAARQIKGLIAASTDKVHAGSSLVGDTRRTIDDVVAQVHRVSGLMADITSAASEQSKGVAQVSQAVTDLDRMTQQNATLAEQSTAAAEGMSSRAVQLAHAVSAFRLDAGQAAH